MTQICECGHIEKAHKGKCHEFEIVNENCKCKKFKPLNPLLKNHIKRMVRAELMDKPHSPQKGTSLRNEPEKGFDGLSPSSEGFNLSDNAIATPIFGSIFEDDDTFFGGEISIGLTEAYRIIIVDKVVGDGDIVDIVDEVILTDTKGAITGSTEGEFKVETQDDTT